MPEAIHRARGNEEIYIGLCGALGSGLKKIGEQYELQLNRLGYNAKVIRLSDLVSDIIETLPGFAHLRKPAHEFEDERLDRTMKMGNLFREKLLSPEAMVLPAIAQIQRIRTARLRAKGFKNAYIIHSIKRPGEIELLRLLYRSNFFAVSVYCPYEKRLKELCLKFRKSRTAWTEKECGDAAEKLIKRDQIENDIPTGQNLQDSFPLGDFFVDQTDDATTEAQVQRFAELVFGHPFHTPTIGESAMYQAAAAALRSSDLSRQVGAAVVGKDGDVLCSGCNEVPKGGGGSFWAGENSKADNRDYRKGYDSNAVTKEVMFVEVFESLRAAGLLSAKVDGKSAQDLAVGSLARGGALKRTRAANIIEFGRAVHAEMNAICDAARRGVSVSEKQMYATTFPCHMCARHIIASGISEVVYIEPYPKSMAKELYPEDVFVDGAHGEAQNESVERKHVAFRPFVGIAPTRFSELFAPAKRKDDRGFAVSWTPEIARLKSYSQLDPRAESDALESLATKVGLLAAATL